MNNARKRIENLSNITGQKIKFYREKAKLSQEELSNQLMFLGVDIQKQGIYKIEKGIRTVVDYELCAIAKCLDITTNELLDDYFNKL